MKQKFFIVMSVICIVLMIGIVGGVENGEPLSNMFWCIPLCMLAYVFALWGEYTNVKGRRNKR